MGSLSGVTSVLSPLFAGLGVPGAIIGMSTNYVEQEKLRDQLRAQQNTALEQLQARQSQDESASAQSALLQKQKIDADAQTAEARRVAALRRAVARQKTLFSAQGLSGDGGSNEAVLLGLYDDSAAEEAAQSRADMLRKTALDQSLNQQKQKNLLEASQLAERQKLTRTIQGF